MGRATGYHSHSQGERHQVSRLSVKVTNITDFIFSVELTLIYFKYKKDYISRHADSVLGTSSLNHVDLQYAKLRR